jgi:L-amino acid N-acyltransferase YncA
LRAEIARGNQASMAIAQAAGFQMRETSGQIAVWYRPGA